LSLVVACLVGAVAAAVIAAAARLAAAVVDCVSIESLLAAWRRREPWIAGRMTSYQEMHASVVVKLALDDSSGKPTRRGEGGMRCNL
jgi:hypothetical protein